MYIDQSQQKYEFRVWLKRLGWLVFLIILLKGVAWLTLPLLLRSAGA